MASGLSPLLAGAGAGAGAALQVHAEPPRLLPQVSVLPQPRTSRSGPSARSFAATLDPAALAGATAAVAAAAVLQRARRRGGTLRALVAACAVKKGVQKSKPKADAVARALEALQQVEQGVVAGGAGAAAAGMQAGRQRTMVAEAEPPTQKVHKDGRTAKRQAAMNGMAGRVGAPAVVQAEHREATQKKPAEEHKAEPLPPAHEKPASEHQKANGVHAAHHEVLPQAEHHDHTHTLEKHAEAPASVAKSLADLVAEVRQAAEPPQEEVPKARDPIHSALEALSHEPPSAVVQEQAPPKVEEDKKPSSALADALAALAGSDLGSFRSAPPEPEAPPSRGTQQVSSADMLDNFLRIPPRRRVEVPVEESQEDDEEEGEKKAKDEEDDDDDDKDDEPMVKRKRRGDSEISAFVLETGGTTGNVGVGLKNVQVRLGGRLILQDASWYVKTGERLAMVGANGCGKTTQLRVLTGEIQPDEGTILLSSPNLKMAVLSQGFVDELDPQRTLREELLSAVPREAAVLKELRELEQEFQALGQDKDGGSEVAMDKIQRLTDLQTLAEQLRVYELDSRFDSIVAKVGFLPEDLDQQVGLFSGGWKVRIGLSKIFMTAPDVLLLDEPTNHLDLESVEWLEKFICTQTLPIVLVSHDREFMDQVATKVCETVEGMTYTYQGGYSDYVQKRDERLAQWQKKYEIQEKKVQELEDFIKINHGKQSMANARNRKIEELTKLKESDDYLDPPPRYMRRIKFKFPEPPQARRGSRKETTLAEMIDVTHGYGDGGDSVLFEGASMLLRAGDKIGIVGRNGAGKSTLLRLLMGTERPRKGSVLSADPTTTGFFTQHQADLLPPDQTALEVVQDGNEVMLGHQELLEVMKKFRFRGDRLKVKVESLSGGEKARLAIVRMMLTPAKLLVFDEPTNHLDIPMKETLEYSLREFEGAVVVVSHDRWFLSQTCTQILAIENGKLVSYNGDYRYYMEKNLDLRKKVEMRYTRDSAGIQPVPYSLKEREERERGGLKKNRAKREAEKRKELIAAVYGTGRRRR